MGCRTRPAPFCLLCDRCSQDKQAAGEDFGSKVPGGFTFLFPDRGRAETKAALPWPGSVSRAHMGWRTLAKHFPSPLQRRWLVMVAEHEISGRKCIETSLFCFPIEVEPRPRPRCLGQGVFLEPTWAVERARHPSVCFATVAPKINRQQVRISGRKCLEASPFCFPIEVEPRPRPRYLGQGVFLEPTWAGEPSRSTSPRLCSDAGS
jgi:hypothetical protein